MIRPDRPSPELVAVGCSAGGLKAMQTLLAGLAPEGMPPIVLCCHTASRDVSSLCDLLSRRTRLPVEEACERHPILPERVYVAPSGYHLLVEESRRFALTVDPKVNFSRPSIDVLFESVAITYQAASLGVILTGANNDGAFGLKCIGHAGGITMVQTPATAEVSNMPQAAMDAAQPDYVEELDSMASLIKQLCRR
ncbi:chemotaxis protein CheB [Frateuria aurantia]